MPYLNRSGRSPVLLMLLGVALYLARLFTRRRPRKRGLLCLFILLFVFPAPYKAIIILSQNAVNGFHIRVEKLKARFFRFVAHAGTAACTKLSRHGHEARNVPLAAKRAGGFERGEVRVKCADVAHHFF